MFKKYYLCANILYGQYKMAIKHIKIMATLTLQVENSSLLEQLKNILSLMKGVRIVGTSIDSNSASLEDTPNATTLAAMKEVESGRDAGIVRMDNLESFMASMEK